MPQGQLEFERRVPEAPDPKAASEDPRWIFYKHMRSEFVRAYSVPLCPDAFSMARVRAAQERVQCGSDRGNASVA